MTSGRYQITIQKTGEIIASKMSMSLENDIDFHLSDLLYPTYLNLFDGIFNNQS